jgi:hypothetical protein
MVFIGNPRSDFLNKTHEKSKEGGGEVTAHEVVRNKRKKVEGDL